MQLSEHERVKLIPAAYDVPQALIEAATGIERGSGVFRLIFPAEFDVVDSAVSDFFDRRGPGEVERAEVGQSSAVYIIRSAGEDLGRVKTRRRSAGLVELRFDKPERRAPAGHEKPSNPQEFIETLNHIGAEHARLIAGHKFIVDDLLQRLQRELFPGTPPGFDEPIGPIVLSRKSERERAGWDPAYDKAAEMIANRGEKSYQEAYDKAFDWFLSYTGESLTGIKKMDRSTRGSFKQAIGRRLFPKKKKQRIGQRNAH